MSRWLQIAAGADFTPNTATDTHQEPSKSQPKGECTPFMMVYDGCRGEELEKAQASGVVEPLPPEVEEMRHGIAINGYPKTWTGKIVSLDAWRNLSKWERHGPDGRHWSGLTKKWEAPT